MNIDESKIYIAELLNRPLFIKIKDMHQGLLIKIDCIRKDFENCVDPIEFSRLNGQVYAFNLCRAMIESIIRFEEIQLERLKNER